MSDKDYFYWVRNPYEYVTDKMCLPVSQDKFSNLFSMGSNFNGFDAWDHLSFIMCLPQWADEYVNFSLGPLAVALKEKDLILVSYTWSRWSRCMNELMQVSLIDHFIVK